MSGIKAPVLSIKERLKTLADLQTVGIWNNQVKYMINGDGYSFPVPACFIEVAPNPIYGDIGLGFQSADLGIRLHLVVVELDAGDGALDENLMVFDLRDKINALISLFEATACGPLTKRSEGQDFDHTNVYHYIIEYTCNFIDSTGSPYDENAGKYKDGPTPWDIVPTAVIDKVTLAENTHFNTNFNFK